MHYAKPYLKVISQQGIITIKNDIVIKTEKINNHVAFVSGDKILLTDNDKVELYQDDRVTWTYKDKAIEKGSVNKLYMADDSNVFCCTNGGLFIINIKNNERTDLLKDIPVSSVCQDIYGNYWITSLTQGVFYLNKEFKNIRYIDNIGNNRIVYTNYKQFFLVKNSSVYEFDTVKNSLSRIPVPFGKDDIPLCNTEHYFGYSAAGVTYLYDKHRKQTISFYPACFKICYPLAGNKFFVTSNNAISSITIVGNKFVINNDLILKEKILHLTFDEGRKKVYLLTGSFLYEYDPQAYRLSIIDTFSSQQNHTGLYSFNDKIIVLTNANHLIVYTTGTNEKKVELPLNEHVFFNFSNIGNNNFLAYTNKGYYLGKVDPGYLLNSSLIKIEYPFVGSEVSALYPFGTNILCNVNGDLYFFDKKLLNKKLSDPALFIDKVSVNGNLISTPVIRVKNTLTCNINILLSSLYFSNSDIRYKYRVKSKEQSSEWFYSNSGDFNLLLPGYDSYEIELKSITENNRVSASKILSIEWLAPFYFTWWFKAWMILLGIITAFYIVYKYNERRRRIFQNELNYMHLEYKAINSLLNPHFIFNAINNIQNLVNQNEPDEANDYLAMLSRLIRQNIENLQFNLIPLEKELSLIRNYIHLQNLRFNGRIILEINNESTRTDLYIPPLLIHTFVENAIVHGFSKRPDTFKISIDITSPVKDYLTIRIADDGIGFNNAEVKESSFGDRTSLGINVTKKRLERLSGFYKVNYKLDIRDLAASGAKGTEVIIELSSRLGDLLPVY